MGKTVIVGLLVVWLCYTHTSWSVDNERSRIDRLWARYEINALYWWSRETDAVRALKEECGLTSESIGRAIDHARNLSVDSDLGFRMYPEFEATARSWGAGLLEIEPSVELLGDREPCQVIALPLYVLAADGQQRPSDYDFRIALDALDDAKAARRNSLIVWACVFGIVLFCQFTGKVQDLERSEA